MINSSMKSGQGSRKAGTFYHRGLSEACQRDSTDIILEGTEGEVLFPATYASIPLALSMRGMLGSSTLALIKAVALRGVDLQGVPLVEEEHQHLLQTVRESFSVELEITGDLSRPTVTSEGTM